MAGRLRQSGVTLPQLDYLARRWPHCLGIIEQAIRPRQGPVFKKILIWAGGRFPEGSSKAVMHLCRKAGLNPHGNRYHHPWHTMAVMIQAALIGTSARLSLADHRMLMLAALFHDFGHRGRLAASAPYAEERRSANLAGRRLFLKPGSGRLRRRFTQVIEATSMTGASPNGLHDSAAAILRDADIFGSLFYRPRTALAFSRSILSETGRYASHCTPDQLLREFILSVAEKGFAHDATRRLASKAGGYPAAVWHCPDAALRLGFRKTTGPGRGGFPIYPGMAASADEPPAPN